MKKQLLICSTFVAYLLLASNAFAQSVHGVLMVVKGDVQVTSSKTNQTQKAKVGDKVFPGDTIVAGVDSRAKVVMTDQNVLNISPSTKIQVAKYEFKPDQDKKNVLLNVVYGKVRATVNQQYDGEKNQFNVKTPSAVAGVRGTDFVTQHSAVTNTSKVIAFSGKVEVGSGFGPGGKIMNPVSVTPGQFTVASAKVPPAAPVKLSAGELQQMNKETAVTDNTSKGDSRSPSSSGGKSGSSSGSKSDSSSSSGSSSGSSSTSGSSGSSSSDSSSSKSDSSTKSDSSSKGSTSSSSSSNSSSSGGSGPAPASVSSAGPSMAASMGPSDADLTATSPSVGASTTAKHDTAPPVDAVCATCGILNQRPVVIPNDFIRGSKTHLTVNFQ